MSKGKEKYMRKSYETFYRDMLNDESKQLYDVIYKVIVERGDRAKIDTNAPELSENIRAALDAIIKDRPEFYFVTGDFEIEGSEVRIKQRQTCSRGQVYDALGKFTDKAREGCSRFFQAEAIYDEIVTRVEECPSYEPASIDDSTIVNPAIFDRGDNEGCCKLMVYAMRDLGNDAAVIYLGDHYCYCMLNLDNGCYKVDFCKRKVSLEQWPESAKNVEWLLENPVEDATTELYYMGNRLFHKMVRDLGKSENGKQLLCEYYKNYGCTFDNLSWDFLQSVAMPGYDLEKEKGIEELVDVLYTLALNMGWSSKSFMEENMERYSEIMTQLHQEIPSEVFMMQAKKKYFQKKASIEGIFRDTMRSFLGDNYEEVSECFDT